VTAHPASAGSVAAGAAPREVATSCTASLLASVRRGAQLEIPSMPSFPRAPRGALAMPHEEGR
jgi:hypothetical protein